MGYELLCFAETLSSLIFCKSCEEIDKEHKERMEERERKALEKKILKNLLDSNSKSKHPKKK